MEGTGWIIFAASIKKEYEGQIQRIANVIWSTQVGDYGKILIVVDDDINCRDWKDVMWAVSTRMDPVRDITPIENTPIDYLDFASPVSGLGGKLGLDATNKIGGETNREWGEKIYMKDDVIKRVDAMWDALGTGTSGKNIWDK